VLTLPSLRNVHLITNGLLPERLFACLEQAKSLCDSRGVSLRVCLSVDGVGEVHEQVRGIPGCFGKTRAILEELHERPGRYCHSFSVGCTLSRRNIPFVAETESFLSSFKGLDVEYHLAVPNRRIHTEDDYKGYYVLEDPRAQRLAEEFFYGKFRTAADEKVRRQCFANYRFLKNNGRGRPCSCAYLRRDVTIDENLDMALCATSGETIGNLKEQTATEIVRGSRARRERRRLEKGHCDRCIHYTYHGLSLKGRWAYLVEGLRNGFAMRYYDVRSRASRAERAKGTILLAAKFVYVFLSRVRSIIWKSR